MNTRVSKGNLSEERRKTLQVALKVVNLIDNGATQGEKDAAQARFSAMCLTNLWLYPFIVTMKAEPVITVKWRKLSDDEISILWWLCKAYGQELWKFGRSKTKRHIQCQKPIADIIKTEFEELQKRWKMILAGTRGAFVYTHIDTSWAESNDAPDWSPEQEAAWDSIYRAFRDQQAMKGKNIKRLEE